MSKLTLSITMSLDGYVAGPEQSEENPLGIGGMGLHEWFFPLKAFRKMHGEHGGEVNASSGVVEERRANTGATIMGRNMFGPVRGPRPDESWRGWWGEDPPYHHPVFVLTRHPHEPLEMQGGTIFHFVSDRIVSALAQAKDAARGLDIWLAGGASVVNQYLTNGWEGHPPASDYVVVVSHRPKPTDWHPDARYHFATSVERGIARAQELAGEGHIAVGAGDVGGQALALGLIDHVAIDVVPVVFGRGKPYFGALPDGHLILDDPDVVVQGDGVLHLRYPVQR